MGLSKCKITRDYRLNVSSCVLSSTCSTMSADVHSTTLNASLSAVTLNYTWLLCKGWWTLQRGRTDKSQQGRIADTLIQGDATREARTLNLWMKKKGGRRVRKNIYLWCRRKHPSLCLWGSRWGFGNLLEGTPSATARLQIVCSFTHVYVILLQLQIKQPTGSALYNIAIWDGEETELR